MGKRILNVDDDPMIRDLVRTILEASEFEVVSADCGTAAIEVLDGEARPINFDCIIMDVQMPEVDGLEATAEIRKWECGLRRRKNPQRETPNSASIGPNVKSSDPQSKIQNPSFVSPLWL